MKKHKGSRKINRPLRMRELQVKRALNPDGGAAERIRKLKKEFNKGAAVDTGIPKT
jgi:hypothetical protein